jgi:hypothetical protein
MPRIQRSRLKVPSAYLKARRRRDVWRLTDSSGMIIVLWHSFLSHATIYRALCTYGAEKLTPEQASDLVSQLETDNAGFIHYLEYVNMMMSS